MKNKGNENFFGQCNSSAFGFGELMSENNSGAYKILSHFDQGLRVHYSRDEDCSYIETMQNNLL